MDIHFGNILLNMVRTEIKHKRIKSITHTFNPGITTIEFVKKYEVDLSKKVRKKHKKRKKNIK